MQVMLVKTSSILQANCFLKCCSAILAKLKVNISLESYVNLCSAPVSGLAEMFPSDVVS